MLLFILSSSTTIATMDISTGCASLVPQIKVVQLCGAVSTGQLLHAAKPLEHTLQSARWSWHESATKAEPEGSFLMAGCLQNSYLWCSAARLSFIIL